MAEQPGKSGRSNPFKPLAVAIPGDSVENSTAATSQPVPADTTKNEPKEPAIQLTAIIGTNIAIFYDGSSSKSVTIGDMIAGMEVESIQSGKVILNKGKKYEVVTGQIPREANNLPITDIEIETYQFTIQAGSYKDISVALNGVDVLKKLGYQAFTHTIQIPKSGTWNRVFAGKYKNKGESLKALRELKKIKEFKDAYITSIGNMTAKMENMQYDKFIIKKSKRYEVVLGGTPEEINDNDIPDSGNENLSMTDREIKIYQFTIQAGAYKDASAALSGADILKKLGYEAFTNTIQTPKNSTWNRVFAGKYKNKDESSRALQKLKKVKEFSDAYVVPMSDVVQENLAVRR